MDGNEGWLVWSGLLYQCVSINVCVHVTVPIPLNVTWMVIKGWLVWSGLLIIPVCLNKMFVCMLQYLYL